MGKVRKIKAREILDSKGDPTVEVELTTEKGKFLTSVPSGISKGKYEALELRDGGKRYKGMGVLRAVKNIKEIIGPKLLGKDSTGQKEIDELMLELDGTKNKSHLGANAILPVSMAICRAGAENKGVSLYRHLSEIYKSPSFGNFKVPIPCFLMIEGGLHAGNKLSFQEFMIVPEAVSFSERLRIGTEIYHTLGEILRDKYGSSFTNVGLEGGFAPFFSSSLKVLDLLMVAIKKAGYKNEAKIILDVAASHFYKDGIYEFEGNTFTREGLLNFYSEIIKNYPILGIEDPFGQEDWEGWKELMSDLRPQISKFLVIGDDLTVTNKKRIKKAIKEGCANGVIIKPNQIGTITETLEAARLAQKAGWEVFVKHRSGETNDTFISDLAIGIGAKYIMTGAPIRGERVVKYNRLLRIEEELTTR